MRPPRLPAVLVIAVGLLLAVPPAHGQGNGLSWSTTQEELLKKLPAARCPFPNICSLEGGQLSGLYVSLAQFFFEGAASQTPLTFVTYDLEGAHEVVRVFLKTLQEKYGSPVKLDEALAHHVYRAGPPQTFFRNKRTNTLVVVAFYPELLKTKAPLIHVAVDYYDLSHVTASSAEAARKRKDDL